MAVNTLTSLNLTFWIICSAMIMRIFSCWMPCPVSKGRNSNIFAKGKFLSGYYCFPYRLNGLIGCPGTKSCLQDFAYYFSLTSGGWDCLPIRWNLVSITIKPRPKIWTYRFSQINSYFTGLAIVVPATTAIQIRNFFTIYWRISLGRYFFIKFQITICII